jgi:hypothetical protein
MEEVERKSSTVRWEPREVHRVSQRALCGLESRALYHDIFWFGRSAHITTSSNTSYRAMKHILSTCQHCKDLRHLASDNPVLVYIVPLHLFTGPRIVWLRSASHHLVTYAFVCVQAQDP